jgi:hypothetical protein
MPNRLEDTIMKNIECITRDDKQADIRLFVTLFVWESANKKRAQILVAQITHHICHSLLT